MTITEVERRFPSDQFVRVHESYPVLLAKIRRISGNEVFTRILTSALVMTISLFCTLCTSWLYYPQV